MNAHSSNNTTQPKQHAHSEPLFTTTEELTTWSEETLDRLNTSPEVPPTLNRAQLVEQFHRYALAELRGLELQAT